MTTVSFSIKQNFLYVVIGLVCCMMMSCYDSDEASSAASKGVVALNVDVIMPSSLREQHQNSIDWAMKNIEKAQRQRSSKVRLNLRFHDEDTEDLGTLAFDLTHPRSAEDTCHAIIGPMRSVNVSAVLPYIRHSNIPLVLPTCSSAVLQRQMANSTNVWLLTESDITQCEVMLSSARLDGDNPRVALVYSDDAYGESFKDWFGFFITEFQMDMSADGIQSFKKGENLQTHFAEWLNDGLDRPLYIFFALSDVEAYKDAFSQLDAYQQLDDRASQLLMPMCTDAAMNEQVIQQGHFFIGTAPVADPSTGFSTNYLSRYGTFPISGDAEVYDALTLIALGEAKALGANSLVNRTLNEWMQQAANEQGSVPANWTDAGLATAFQRYAVGADCKLIGALGPYTLDASTHTKRLQNTYMTWMPLNGVLYPLKYYSTAGTSGSSSVAGIWEWNQSWRQMFDETLAANVPKVPVTDRWALLVTPSHLWESYRHQADVFAMYQVLREHGYDDDHIVLVSEDNLADAPENHKTPGRMYVELGGEDVRRGTKVDYRPSQLAALDIYNILAGNQSERLPHVLHTSPTSDVFIYWSGHGNGSDGPLWSDIDEEVPFGCRAIGQIVRQLHDEGKFRRMMLAVETCYSGLWGETLEGIPNVVVFTAANTMESSKADVWDVDRQTFLSNGFTRAFRTAVDNNPGITLRDLYLQLARSTTGSHVTLYNERQYGSVYLNGMGDYLAR